MNLIEQIDQDLNDALRQRDEAKLAVLRLIKTSITNVEKQAGKPPTPDQVVDVIHKEINQRQDTIAQLEASRPELIKKDKQAIEMLTAYLPEQLPADELKNIIDKAVAQTGASSAQDMGKVMAAVMPQTRGRAGGKLVSQLVKERLAK